MQIKSFLAFAGLASAQGMMPNASVCDKYTTALLKDNTAANQYKLLQLVVNTVIIGNYTKPNVGISVPGILKPATYMGEKVNLAPYFSGGLKSTNRNGQAASVNFLDGGAATPLMNTSLPAAGSNQLRLVTHLYQYFGALLGCSHQGQMGFPAYAGSGNQYEVHRFMALTNAEVGYFISQVGAAAQSFGVTEAEVMTVGQTLGKTFNYKCSPPATVIPSQGMMTQSICSADSCPLAPMSNCGAYPNGGKGEAMATNSTMPPSNGTSTTGSGSGSGSDSGSGSGSGSGSPSSSSAAPGASSTATSNDAASKVASYGVAAVAAAAFAVAL